MLIVSLGLLTACTTGDPVTRSTPTPTPTAATPTPEPPVLRGDELGVVPVLMYHQLLAKPRGVYDQTPAQFRAELITLYAAGYRTITAADLVSGRIDVPAGRSPMVLTFDDSTTSQYAELPDGRVDPQSAVGILLHTAQTYGETRPVATFYVNSAPFAGRDRYLASLASLGMELGEHTAGHANLHQLDATGVQRELVKGLNLIRRAAPQAPVTTMALPFGARPRDAQLSHRGAFGGQSYRFAGVMLVGSGPAKSPYHRGFDGLAVPRIRSGLRTGDQAFTSTYWLPRLQATRFVSDGDPDVISFPRAKRALLSPHLASRANPY